MRFLNKDYLVTSVSRAVRNLFGLAPAPPAIHIKSGFMGATKQMPYLLRELRDALPETLVDVQCEDFHGQGDGKKTLEQDLKRFDSTLLDYVRINPTARQCYDLRVKIAMDVPFVNELPYPKDSEITSIYSEYAWTEKDTLNLWVEPLKFERRPKLPDYRIELLKERYKLGGARVILGGAIHIDEFKEFCHAVDYAAEHNPLRETVGIIVPRTSPNHMSNLMYQENIDFEKDRIIFKREHRQGSKVLITQNGALQDLYSLCDVAFVGDTLWTTETVAGQNPLEPAFYGKKIVVGKNHTWNEEAYAGLRNSGLLVEVENQEALNKEFARDFSRDELEVRVAAANKFIDSRQGAARVYARKIAEHMLSNEYVTEGKRTAQTA